MNSHLTISIEYYIQDLVSSYNNYLTIINEILKYEESDPIVNLPRGIDHFRFRNTPIKLSEWPEWEFVRMDIIEAMKQNNLYTKEGEFAWKFWHINGKAKLIKNLIMASEQNIQEVNLTMKDFGVMNDFIEEFK